jgi:hypothetical protein
MFVQKPIALSYQLTLSVPGEDARSLASKLHVYIENAPKLHNPIMVCGLPDSGNVAKLVIEQLVKQLKAEKFAEIYSNSLPPRVRILENGTVDVMKHSMFYWNNRDGKEIVLYTGDAQPASPEAAYALADKALEIGQSLGADTVLTVGAYITGEFSDEPKVFVTGNDKQLLGEFEAIGVSQINEGSVTWMNGLLVGLSKLRNMKAIFISGETSGYIVDAKAASAVLRVLSRKLGIPLDLTELDLKTKESDQLVKSIGAMKERAKKDERGYIG